MDKSTIDYVTPDVRCCRDGGMHGKPTDRADKLINIFFFGTVMATFLSAMAWIIWHAPASAGRYEIYKYDGVTDDGEGIYEIDLT